ncbi:SAM-dependent methyltransferase/FKBP-type peptidyl-prolyl cis-trans isomerase 2 [Desulfosalsimonas propionicica]|uniref:SAM-dependent methyltransferase/FKBP-type peptidyl-prolyl cis-trans isomerase 2 n=1 Tax=Desulfosalsimonas propionicica TaxID=332175 RepID=A0A7W0C7G7_9BACT|nr:methyltransferase domain-containing protein [Desulfosalsimonas propionicica]MBA2880542.1 SAM-dependent methyltransferase/FKBP-type peptidyl-prolyl cis-trans isomerase 2 [Desulfosalsimonas propionicica]
MNEINQNSLADIEFQMRWISREAEHTDSTLVMVNFWRDLLPDAIYEGLMGAGTGDEKTFGFATGEVIAAPDPDQKIRTDRKNFDETRAVPAFGRFYPRGVLRGVYNVFPQNVAPMRCTGVDEKSVDIDFNHSLAGYDLEITARVHTIYDKPFDRGGNCRLLMDEIASGPGMQARCQGMPTDFFHDRAFCRTDETEDAAFYENPRLVQHLDQRAIETISAIYSRFITPEMHVLDLMSSWQSHIDQSTDFQKMTGLGMNEAELAKNDRLTDYFVHDLNKDPRLPFDDQSFDLILCTASVEYLTSPMSVFKDAARVLRSGGVMIQTFSNRWFPPKAIRLWTELHEFERMGLVKEYFLQSEKFSNPATLSFRGWDRPETDKYYPDMPQSDPVFAVWAGV